MNRPSDKVVKNKKNSKHSAERRHILTLAATGLPMVLTMKASARQSINSALTCAFRLPARVRVLVDDQGNAWANPTTLNINYRADRGGFRIDHIQRFKDDPNTIFISGGVSSSTFLPNACPSGVPGPNDNRQDCGYAVWRTNRNIDPSDYLNQAETAFVSNFYDSGSNSSSQNGLYVELSQALHNGGVSQGWFGISCIASILNSLD